MIFPQNVNVKWSMNNERCNWPMFNVYEPISHLPVTSFIVHGPFDIYILRKRKRSA
jgi:hypothetical protein